MKRILLFVLTNVMVVVVVGIVASLLGVNRFLTPNGLDLGALMGYALIMGLLILLTTLFVWFKEAIGEKAGVAGEGWSATWKQNKSSQKIDYKLLLEALKPAVEVVDAYTREVPGARVFKFKTEEVDK